MALSNWAAPAKATLIANEPFVIGEGQYTAGIIRDQNPPVQGFTGPWTATSTGYTASTTTIPHSKATWATGGSVQFPGGSTVFARNATRSLAAYSPANTYYFSALSSRNTAAGWGSTSDKNLAGFTNGAKTEGVEFGYHRVSGTSPDFVIRVAGSDTSTVVSNDFVTSSRRYLTILKLEVNVNGTEDRLSYWISGDRDVSGVTTNSTYDVSSEAALNASTLTAGQDFRGVLTGEFVSATNSITDFGIINPGVSGGVNYDEVRMGTTYLDVVPVPEPAAASLAVLAGAALAVRRRRLRCF